MPGTGDARAGGGSRRPPGRRARRRRRDERRDRLACRRALAGRSGTPLTCAIHVVDPSSGSFSGRESCRATRSFRLQFFNVFDAGARRSSPTIPSSRRSDRSFASPADRDSGVGRLGKAVVVPGGPSLERTLPDAPKPSASIWSTASRRHRGELRSGPGLEAFVAARPASPRLRLSRAGEGSDSSSPMSRTVHRRGSTFSSTTTLSVSPLALSVRHRLGPAAVPIVVRMARDAGLARFSPPAKVPLPRGLGLARFRLSRTYLPPRDGAGRNQRAARPRDPREVPVANGLAAGRIRPVATRSFRGTSSRTSSASRIAGRPDQIRRQAANRRVRRRPFDGVDGRDLPFHEEEIETMARMEHERWRPACRRGVEPGPVRCDAKKSTRSLVPWETLDDTGRAQSRGRPQLPATLAHAASGSSGWPGREIARERGGAFLRRFGPVPLVPHSPLARGRSIPSSTTGRRAGTLRLTVFSRAVGNEDGGSRVPAGASENGRSNRRGR